MKLSSLQGKFVKYSNWGAVKIWFIVRAYRENNYQLIIDYYSTYWSQEFHKDKLQKNTWEFPYAVFQRNAFQQDRQISDGAEIQYLEEDSCESMMKDFIRACFNV